MEGIEVEINKRFIALRSRSNLDVLSSAVLNGGISKAKSILNYHVQKNFDHSNPAEFLRKKSKELGLPVPRIGMMTAADLENTSSVTLEDGDLVVGAVVSVGVSIPLTVGDYIRAQNLPSTINAIVLVDSKMEVKAMVDALRVVTEAKTVALGELDVRGKGSYKTASGTPTDSVAIACTGRGKKYAYSGPVTKVGSLIGRSVREAVRKSLIRDGFSPGRSLWERLEERGISRDQVVNSAWEGFVYHPSLGAKEEIIQELENRMDENIKDINIASLIIAGLRLEEDGKLGLIPNLPPDRFGEDPVSLLADEILGMRIANYIAGSKGVFEFVRIDKSKPGILGTLGPFLDDVIGGLIAGVCSKAYERKG